VRERFLVLLFGAAALAASAMAEVKVVLRPDGTHFMYNSRSRHPNGPVTTPHSAGQKLDLDAIIERSARDARLEGNLVRAVIRTESAFDVRAVSRRGAMGLMQLMPRTVDDLGVSDPFDPQENVRAGTRYLRRMLDAFDGNLELALAAYNAGPEAVRRFAGIPPYRETVEYVEKVMRLYRADPGYIVRSSRSVGKGRRTYLSRDPGGVLLLTTTPPRGG
jgi:soluble lytic murein transglycosylase-like protein